MKTKDISIAGLIAAVYTIVAVFLAPISFGVYQVRISEALTILPFLTPAAIPGLFIGCALANIFGGMGWVDITFGSLLTLAAAFMTRGTFHLTRTKLYESVALLAIALLWIGSLYTLLESNFNYVSLILPIPAVFALGLSEKYRSEGRSNRRVSIIRGISFGILLYIGFKLVDQPELVVAIVGEIALLGAWLATWVLFRMWYEKRNLNLILAPLPPVLVNAFGVSAYLAPIIEVDYWFAVQMIGVGQLIACYVVGLPLLLALEKRKAYFFN